MIKTTISKKGEVKASITYEGEEIIRVTGPEEEKMRKIFSKTYDILSGYEAEAMYVTEAIKKKPKDKGYIRAVLLDILQLGKGYDLETQEL